MSGIGTPQYPPSRGSARTGALTSPAYGSIHGSRTSLGGSVSGEPAVVNIDPVLINPADAAPKGTPRDIQPQSPADLAEFTLPGYEDSKKKTKGGFGDTFKGGFGKMKGIFKKAPQEIPNVGSGIEEEDDDVMGSQEYLDKVETPPGGGNGADKQSTMQKFQNLFKKAPEMASPAPYQPGDVVDLKTEPKSTESYITFGNFINVMLIVLIVAGIIMCACIGVEDALYYIGPACLGLATFALVGKFFYTSCFWNEPVVPEFLKPTVAMHDQYLGGKKDPYSCSNSYTKPVATYYGPMTTVVKQEVVQMETFSYPMRPQPRMQPSPAPSSNTSFSPAAWNPGPASLDYSDDHDRLPPLPSYT